MGKRNRNKTAPFFSDNFWQSSNFNKRVYAKNLDMFLSLAINRFRWEGLPDTCDARFLEWQLHRNGIATLCHDRELPDVWQTLIAAPYGDFNVYGIPTAWRAMGYNGTTQYDVGNDNGALCYYAKSRVNPWNALEIYARRLTHFERTEDINLGHQQKPLIFVAPQEKKLELINLMKQVEGFEPAILGNDNFKALAENVTTIDTKVPYIGDQLRLGETNIIYSVLMYLGIPHLAFEKGERMIEDEARANTAATNIMFLDCVGARREFCDTVNYRFGLNVKCYFNDDWESYNYNYLNNAESIAQDGLLLPDDGSGV